MKIPETSANVGAYYGNEENGQWQTMYLQPNGVIIDNGVGGGVVGSGDAGVRPVYPVHIPRHMPAGYVMAGAYYPPQFAPPVPPQPADFEDYMWMENEEEFDKQVIQQLEEEALMEQCIEAMLEDEKRERRGSRGPRPPRDPNAPTTSTCNGNPGLSLQEAVSRSTLNPLAAEFVPTRVRLPPANPDPQPTTEVKAESTEANTEKQEPSRTEESDAAETRPQVTDDTHTEGTLPPPKDPPEVSAADVQPIQKSKPRDKRPDPKKPPKVVHEVKKVKPVVVKSETKPTKKEIKEVKVSKSEADESTASLVSAKSEDAVDSAPKHVPVEEEAFPGLKPINYAAAAKAMKPKPKPTEKELKPVEKELKPAEKELKPVDKELKPVDKKELKPIKSATKASKDKVRKNSTK